MMDSTETSDGVILDPAEYLFTNTKYHDCHFTVGDSSTDSVEEMGVVTVYLVSQSSVFRAMLEDSVLADHTGDNTHITDISPEIFKLMLRFIYGGVMPQISRDTMAELLLCADKYNIQPLVKWSSKRLIPTTVNELFPALKCVVYVDLPDILHHVTKILQEQTAELVKSEQFHSLDDKCMEFITKQETLGVSELQLWLCLVGWAEARTEDAAEQRRLISKPLQHIRFLVFTQEQILKEIMNSNILSSVEVVHILSAVTNNQDITMTGLCSIREKRVESCLPENNPTKSVHEEIEDIYNMFHLSETFDFNITNGTDFKSTQASEYENMSYAIITCSKKPVLLESFIIKTRSIADEHDSTYYLRYEIKVHRFDKNSSIKDLFLIRNACIVVSSMGSFALELKLDNVYPLVLTPNTCYNFAISFNKSHPVFCSYEYNYTTQKWSDITCKEKCGSDFSVKFNSPRHLTQIKYKYPLNYYG